MSNPLTMKLEQLTRFTASERMRLDELLQHKSKTYQRGQTIISAGKKVDEIHLVTSGLATRSKTLRDGSRQMMAFLVPGDLCDVEVFVLEAMDHDILALNRTTCALIPAAEMEKLLTESSNLTRALWWSTMTDSAVLREWIVNHGQRDARERIAHIFCELLIRYRIVGEGLDNAIPFPLTQEELAEATGMTPIHVNRMLHDLRAERVIELGNRTLRVVDFERLAEIAQYEPAYLHLVRTEKADPAVFNRVGDLLPASSGGVFQKAWQKVTHPLTQE
ncbi:MAG TPA: Crp/Fnr family transcriptional regulator [Sphingomicrobium sp.]|jgi:CRP-like cAMP-binding protein